LRFSSSKHKFSQEAQESGCSSDYLHRGYLTSG